MWREELEWTPTRVDLVHDNTQLMCQWMMKALMFFFFLCSIGKMSPTEIWDAEFKRCLCFNKKCIRMCLHKYKIYSEAFSMYVDRYDRSRKMSCAPDGNGCLLRCRALRKTLVLMMVW